MFFENFLLSLKLNYTVCFGEGTNEFGAGVILYVKA